MATAAPAAAQNRDIPQALVGARVVIAPGRVLESGTVVLRDGAIVAVGAEVEVPSGAQVRDLEGLTVYPGLIESFSPRQWLEVSGEDEEAPAMGHDNPLVGPERDVVDAEADSSLVKKLRAAGFTTAVAVPAEGLLRGNAAIYNLGDGDPRDRLLRRRVAQTVAFATRGDGYPGSVMGSVALLRQAVLDAGWYREAHSRYAANTAQRRPAYNASLEALQAAASGEQLVLFESKDPLDALRWARVAEELGLRSYVVGSGREYEWLEPLAATGLPLLLPVDFPDEPSVDGEDDLSVSLAKLRAWDQAPNNPQRLAEAGVELALTSHRLASPKEIHPRIAQAIERGFTAEGALAALTTVPARLFGLESVAGTIEVGKMANLVVVDGELFTESPKIRELWIDGLRFELQEIEPAAVDPRGTWELQVDAGGQQMSLSMTVSGEIDDLGGSVSVMGTTLTFSEAYVTGETLVVHLDASSVGAAGEFIFRMRIEGDRGSGSGDSPMGSFSFSARRTSGAPEGQR